MTTDSTKYYGLFNIHRPRGFHKLLEILIIVAQKSKKSCQKVAHFPRKVATFQKSCSKVATLIALPSTAISTFEHEKILSMKNFFLINMKHKTIIF